LSWASLSYSRLPQTIQILSVSTTILTLYLLQRGKIILIIFHTSLGVGTYGYQYYSATEVILQVLGVYILTQEL
jgi:hypothetical protein